MKLLEKTALVTEASRAIGGAIALWLADEGADVASQIEAKGRIRRL